MLVVIGFFLGRFYIKKNLVFVFSTVFFIFFSIIILRYFFYGIDVARVDVNHLYLLVALPIYFGFAYSLKTTIFSVIPYVALVQLTCSFIQQYLCLIGSCDEAGSFLNYYSQELYVPPVTEIGFYRTYGLFNESSQYAGFLVFYIILVQIGLVKTRCSALLALFAFIDLLINNSITAYLMLFAYLLVNIRLRLVDIFALFLITCFIVFNLEKILTTLLLSAETHPRLMYAVDEVMRTWNNFPLFGRGLSWDSPTWDVLSIYFTGYGLFGFFVIVVSLIAIFLYFPISLVVPYFVYSLTNGLFLGSLNILILIYFIASLSNLRRTIEFK